MAPKRGSGRGRSSAGASPVKRKAVPTAAKSKPHAVATNRSRNVSKRSLQKDTSKTSQASKSSRASRSSRGSRGSQKSRKLPVSQKSPKSKSRNVSPKQSLLSESFTEARSDTKVPEQHSPSPVAADTGLSDGFAANSAQFAVDEVLPQAPQEAEAETDLRESAAACAEAIKHQHTPLLSMESVDLPQPQQEAVATEDESATGSLQQPTLVRSMESMELEVLQQPQQEAVADLDPPKLSLHQSVPSLATVEPPVLPRRPQKAAEQLAAEHEPAKESSQQPAPMPVRSVEPAVLPQSQQEAADDPDPAHVSLHPEPAKPLELVGTAAGSKGNAGRLHTPVQSLALRLFGGISNN